MSNGRACSRRSPTKTTSRWWRMCKHVVNINVSVVHGNCTKNIRSKMFVLLYFLHVSQQTVQELGSCWDGRPFGRNRHGLKSMGMLCPFPRGELTQCCLGRVLYLRTKWCLWSIHRFGHNRHGPKIGGWGALWVEAGSPSNTVWPGPRPTIIPSGIVIHPTVWPQYVNVTDRQTGQTDKQRSDSTGRTVLQTVAQESMGTDL